MSSTSMPGNLMQEHYRQTVYQMATNAANTTALVIPTGALLAFAALVLGTISGWLGGPSGVVHPVFAARMISARRPPA